METEICILHFNDVVRLHTVLHPRDSAKSSSTTSNEVELISRFAGFIRSFELKPLVIFSGDVFSPSLEASLLKGEHMVNHLNIDVACYGNHGLGCP
jgi:2',3'-cyclic-nucleotide 2'-phosphodiesterase (5'-nucleotidase family)